MPQRPNHKVLETSGSSLKEPNVANEAIKVEIGLPVGGADYECHASNS